MKHLGIVKALAAGLMTFSVLSGLYLYNANLNSLDIETVTANRKIALEGEMQSLESEIKNNPDFNSSRANFLEEVDTAKTVSAEVANYTDVSSFLSILKDAQKVVAAENSKEFIDIQTIRVKKESSEMQERANALKKYGGAIPREEIIKPTEVGNPKGLITLPAKHPARLILDEVGGQSIKLGTAEKVCDWDGAAGCAYTAGVILIAEDYANEDEEILRSLMLHEYAHHVQFKHQVALDKSPTFEQLFKWDAEWLADCMAMTRQKNYTSGYEYKCSEQQKAYGSKVWQGIIE